MLKITYFYQIKYFIFLYKLIGRSRSKLIFIGLLSISKLDFTFCNVSIIQTLEIALKRHLLKAPKWPWQNKKCENRRCQISYVVFLSLQFSSLYRGTYSVTANLWSTSKMVEGTLQLKAFMGTQHQILFNCNFWTRMEHMLLSLLTSSLLVYFLSNQY